jgi:hypothetical protein
MNEINLDALRAPRHIDVAGLRLGRHEAAREIRPLASGSGQMNERRA